MANNIHAASKSALGIFVSFWFVLIPSTNFAQSIEYVSRDEVEAAIDRYTKLMEVEPNNAALYIKRADAHFQLHEFDQAIKDYTAAIEQDNSLDSAFFGRGLAYGRRRLIDEGIADLDVFIQRNPNSSLAYTKRGVRYLWKRDLLNASKDLEKAIELNSNNAEAHDDLGVVYSLQNRYREAISRFIECVAIDPSYQKGYHNLAMSLYAIEKDQWALNAINESLKLKPDAKDSVKLKGLILSALGRDEEAEAFLEDAEFLPDGHWSTRVSIDSVGVDADLVLTGVDENKHKFIDFFDKGQWVVLNIWGPNCPPCVEEMPQLQAFHDQHANQDIVVVGVAIDYPSFTYAKLDQVRQFMDSYFISFPVFLGDAELIPRFGAGPLSGVPMTIVYAPDGRLIGHQVGKITANRILELIDAARPEFSRRNPQ